MQLRRVDEFSLPRDLDALVAEAARDLANYQRMTAKGKLSEAGQKLENLRCALRTSELPPAPHQNKRSARRSHRLLSSHSNKYYQTVRSNPCRLSC